MYGSAALALLLSLAGGDRGHLESHFEELPEEGPRLYEPPAPGTYELPPIDRVSEHLLIGADGGREALPGVAREQVALVSFVYTHCADAGGCPAALALVRRLDRSLAERAELRGRVRLVTVSFDPARDTPERMALLREVMAPRGDWRFLTAPDVQAIQPVLDDYGQDALRRAVTEGAEPRVMRHVLKVFLVDGGGAVRNVYSSGFLDWRVVLNDIATVLQTGAAGP